MNAPSTPLAGLAEIAAARTHSPFIPSGVEGRGADALDGAPSTSLGMNGWGGLCLISINPLGMNGNGICLIGGAP